MGRLAIQITAALILVYQVRKHDGPWWAVLGALAVGAILVHLVYDFVDYRLLGNVPGHLGAAAISTDDPLMLSAFEEAQRTWPQFLELFGRYPRDSLVKFRFRVQNGEVENVWGDLLELEAGSASVYLRTLPVGDADLSSRRLSIPTSDIVDWQVMVEDGTLRGGYTQQATFRIMERENGSLHPKFVRELARYRPVDEPAV